MSTNREVPDPPGLEFFEKNRAQFPPEELAKYAGLHIAFSADGTQILASGADMDEVERKLIAAGINPNQVVGSYVPPLDTVIL